MNSSRASSGRASAGMDLSGRASAGMDLSARASATLKSSSGRSSEEEYQRTIGALFGVYWFLRLDQDGPESFCFGLDPDNSWAPQPAVPDTEVTKLKDILFPKTGNLLIFDFP